jgi:hypothetical protein
VRDDFDARLRREVAAESESNRYLAELLDGDPSPPRLPAERLPRRPLVWDAGWAKRARNARKRGVPRDDFQAERERLVSLDLQVAWGVLTGEPVEGRRRVQCPLPEHEDRHPDCDVTERVWRCVVCDKGGTIYELASALWGLGTRGSEFREIHERLCTIFDIREFRSAA